MSSTDTAHSYTGQSRRPKRADAQRNYDKLVAAAREAFTEAGEGAKLDDIAKRAGVGPGTLYRNFPTRRHLLEAVYIDEVEAMAAAAEPEPGEAPWDTLRRWTSEFVGYITTKRAIGNELLNYVDRDSPVIASCRGAVMGAGEALVARAQASGDVRDDVTFDDIWPLLSGIATTQATSPGTTERSLDLVLDGVRYRPPAD